APARGLSSALAMWCLLVFGVDLGLILVGGSEWVQANSSWWVGALMLSPLDVYRVTLLFVVERAAFSEAELQPLTRWWLDHTAAWLAICLTGWCIVAAAAAAIGAVRRRTR